MKPHKKPHKAVNGTVALPPGAPEDYYTREKRCPNCEVTKNVFEGFGWKRSRSKINLTWEPQAWCRPCKNDYGHPTLEGRALVREDLPKPFSSDMRRCIAKDPGLRKAYENLWHRIIDVMLLESSVNHPPATKPS